MKRLNSSKLFTKGVFREVISFAGSTVIIQEPDKVKPPLEYLYLKDSNNLFLKSSDGLSLVVRGG